MTQPALVAAFAPGSIETGVQAADREQAILVAARLLVASGRTTDAYGAEMLDALNEFGPYFVLAPGIAIAHARPSTAVLSSGLSLAVLAQPIEFGSDHNDPVRLVFALCAVDHESHLDMLSELATLLTDTEKINFLLNATSSEQIRVLLSQPLGQ
jgi:PTS system ascorbate-specific IIA component